MVNATDWLNKYYPTNGTCTNTNDTLNCGSDPKKRSQITSLDVSHQNLEGILELEDFTDLLKLNASYNNLTGFNPAGSTNMTTQIYESRIIQEVDFSHNVHTGNFGNWSAPALKIFNFSYNQLNSSSFTAPNLIYLDASNNDLNNLNLSQSCQNLEVLKCSNNSLNPFGEGLILTNAPNLKFFDCLGVNFYPSSVTTIITTPSNFFNTPEIVGIAAGTGLGTAALTTGLSFLVYRRCRNNQARGLQQQPQIPNQGQALVSDARVQDLGIGELPNEKETESKNKQSPQELSEKQYQTQIEVSPSHSAK